MMILANQVLDMWAVSDLLDCLKNIFGFSTKMDDKLPGVFSAVVARRKGVRVVPLKRAPDAVPKLVMLI